MKRGTGVLLALLALMAGAAGEAGAETVDARVVARYDVDPGRMRPLFDSVEIASLGMERVQRRSFRWLQFAAWKDGNLAWAVKLLVSDLGFMEDAGRSEPEVARYQFLEGGAKPWEYVDARDGKPYLPGVNFWVSMVPHAVEGGMDHAFFAEGEYMGRRLTRAASSDQPEDRILRPGRMELQPDLLIGGPYLRNRDTLTERFWEQWEPWPSEQKVEYVELTAEDYLDLIARGATFFGISTPDVIPVLRDQPVFFSGGTDVYNPVALLYRGNYFGLTNFMDEPGNQINARYYIRARNPRANAEQFIGSMRYQWLEHQRGHLRWAPGLLSPLLVETRYPTWETVAGSAWFGLQAGVYGHVAESRFQPEWFAELSRRALDVDFPTDPESVIKFHIATYRGAAETFGRPWGFAIYGQMHKDCRPLAFPMSYDAGATYFWFWPGVSDHGGPFFELVDYIEALRDHRHKHPRDLRKLAEARRNRVCIALPVGYILDEATLNNHALWRNDYLGLDIRNTSGATYGEVLASAMREVVQCLESGIDFDLAYWNGGGDLSHYREIRRVLTDASVLVTGPDSAPKASTER